MINYYQRQTQVIRKTRKFETVLITIKFPQSNPKLFYNNPCYQPFNFTRYNIQISIHHNVKHDRTHEN